MQNNKNVSDTAVPAMNSSITIRVSQKEKDHIIELATKCGFKDVSTYIRARALNFRPKMRLTPLQEKLLENLDGCRSDIYHYKNALGALSPEERKALLRQYSFLLAWVKDLGKIGNRLLAFLEAVRKPNPSRLGKEDDNGKEGEV